MRVSTPPPTTPTYHPRAHHHTTDPHHTQHNIAEFTYWRIGLLENWWKAFGEDAAGGRAATINMTSPSEVVADWTAFATVRNPYLRALSSYYWRVESDQVRRGWWGARGDGGWGHHLSSISRYAKPSPTQLPDDDKMKTKSNQIKPNQTKSNQIKPSLRFPPTPGASQTDHMDAVWGSDYPHTGFGDYMEWLEAGVLGYHDDVTGEFVAPTMAFCCSPTITHFRPATMYTHWPDGSPRESQSISRFKSTVHYHNFRDI